MTGSLTPRTLLATAPGLAVQLAALLPLRSIYSEQANALVLDCDGVAVDDPGPTGDVGLDRV